MPKTIRLMRAVEMNKKLGFVARRTETQMEETLFQLNTSRSSHPAWPLWISATLRLDGAFVVQIYYIYLAFVEVANFLIEFFAPRVR